MFDIYERSEHILDGMLRHNRDTIDALVNSLGERLVNIDNLDVQVTIGLVNAGCGGSREAEISSATFNLEPNTEFWREKEHAN